MTNTKLYKSRIVKRKTEDEEWEIIPFKELRDGDVFMLYEPDGEGPIVNNAGEVELKCTSDAYQGPHGPDKMMVWTVEIEDKETS